MYSKKGGGKPAEKGTEKKIHKHFRRKEALPIRKGVRVMKGKKNHQTVKKPPPRKSFL